MVTLRLANFSVLRLTLASAFALVAVACGHGTSQPNADPASEVKPDDPPADSASSSAAATDGTGGAATAEKGATSAPSPKSSAPGGKTTPATPATSKAAPGGPNPPAAVPIPGTAQDIDVAAQLTTALAGVVFVSEAQFPWSVLQADATAVTDITPSVVADRFGAMIAQLDGGEGRDLSQLRAVTDDEGYAAFLEDMGSDPSDPAGPSYLAAEKLVAESLQGTQVFFFDMNRAGSQITGPIITVVVGKTAANKLVAMVSFQVSS